MARRRSEEARVLAYFEETPVEKAELMLGLIRDVVRRRVAPTKVERVVKKRSKVGKATTGRATDFTPDVLEPVPA